MDPQDKLELKLQGSCVLQILKQMCVQLKEKKNLREIQVGTRRSPLV